MFCTSCGNIELTPKEERSEAQRCMLCVMIHLNKYAETLGLSEDKRRVDRNRYGRSAEEYQEFMHIAAQTAAIPKEQDIPPSRGPGSAPPRPGSSFERAVNEQLGSEVFPAPKVRTISANGVTEDIKLTLELPEIYPIEEKYYNSTQKLLEQTLKYIIHLLAFSPMAGQDWEAYLRQQIEDAKKNGGGGIGY